LNQKSRGEGLRGFFVCFLQISALRNLLGIGPTRQVIGQVLRRLVAGIGQGEHLLAIDHFVGPRAHHQNGGHAFEPFRIAITGGDLRVAVELAHIHHGDDIVRVHEFLHRRHQHQIVQHYAVRAPIAAFVDQKQLVGLLGPRHGVIHHLVGIGLLVIDLHAHDRQVGHLGIGQLGRRIGESSLSQAHRGDHARGDHQRQFAHHSLSNPRPLSRAFISGSRPRKSR
jgi:hypothetical protein